jgi:hypothetical protein
VVYVCFATDEDAAYLGEAFCSSKCEGGIYANIQVEISASNQPAHLLHVVVVNGLLKLHCLLAHYPAVDAHAYR